MLINKKTEEFVFFKLFITKLSESKIVKKYYFKHIYKSDNFFNLMTWLKKKSDKKIYIYI